MTGRIHALLAPGGWRDVVLCGATALFLGLAFSAVRSPVPFVADEFSYLLGAETMAAGRLANPPHPMWQHFETFHVVHQPWYVSKYPPGQALFLALGMRLAGQPAAGVWISSALAVAAICWMLRGWLPGKGRWPLFGGMLAALHGSMQVDWTQSFWGGWVAALGGALMLGALPRLLRQPRLLEALVLALGAVVLAVSRPFEGAVLALCVGVVLLAWFVKLDGPARRHALRSVAAPALLAAALGLGWLGFYNLRTTGDAMRMPYDVYEETYGYTPVFFWQGLSAPPEYRHAEMRRLYIGWAAADFLEQQSLGGFVAGKWRAFAELWRFFFGLSLSLPLVALPLVLRDKRLAAAWATLAAVYFASWLSPWNWPHYVAPATALVFLLVVAATAHLESVVRARTGREGLVVGAVLALHLMSLGAAATERVTSLPQHSVAQRPEIVEILTKRPGKDVVLVRYGDDHNLHDEWVYNAADIDAAEVVWAREMGWADDRRLLEYFADRKAWLLEPDRYPLEVVPYGGNGK